MRNVLHHAVHRPAEEHVVLVVHGDDDEELGLTRRVVQPLSERVLVVNKVVGIAGYGRVPHLCELVALPDWTLVEQHRGNIDIDDEVSSEQSELISTTCSLQCSARLSLALT
jgi:hypothetical protein